MTLPKTEAAMRDQYLAEANAELDAMLGEVGEIEPTPPSMPAPARSLLRLVVIAVIAVAVFALGILLLRSRRPNRLTMHLVR
jgi:hypothetical protein